MRRILLVEPGYRNKYPPLGLMKLSAYHKRLDDNVVFVKGCDAGIRAKRWDRIYVSTLFTFFWDETVRTIRYYLGSTDDPHNVIVGGVLATLLRRELQVEVPVRIVPGLLDSPGILDAGSKVVIDHLIPDYNILSDVEYDYGISDAYIGYATRGCPNKCSFCAVSTLEPHYLEYLPLKRQVKGIEQVYGAKRDLVLLDNNVLASGQFDQIIQDVLDLGFGRGVKVNNRLRRLDFNQGIDARRLTRHHVEQLAKTAIMPMRLAFDNIKLRPMYERAIRLAAESGILRHSTYVLYNYNDTPEDFYERMKLGVLLNDKLGTKISSFPMKFIPLDAKDRKFVGKHWSKKLIRGVQCILLATRGMVSPRKEFFEAAFGATAAEFEQIASMPEEYIIYRRRHENNGALEWLTVYNKLSPGQKQRLMEVVSKGPVRKEDVMREGSARLRSVLAHYLVTADGVEKVL